MEAFSGTGRLSLPGLCECKRGQHVSDYECMVVLVHTECIVRCFQTWYFFSVFAPGPMRVDMIYQIGMKDEKLLIAFSNILSVPQRCRFDRDLPF